MQSITTTFHPTATLFGRTTLTVIHCPSDVYKHNTWKSWAWAVPCTSFPWHACSPSGCMPIYWPFKPWRARQCMRGILEDYSALQITQTKHDQTMSTVKYRTDKKVPGSSDSSQKVVVPSRWQSVTWSARSNLQNQKSGSVDMSIPWEFCTYWDPEIVDGEKCWVLQLCCMTRGYCSWIFACTGAAKSG